MAFTDYRGAIQRVREPLQDAADAVRSVHGGTGDLTFANLNGMLDLLARAIFTVGEALHRAEGHEPAVEAVLASEFADMPDTLAEWETAFDTLVTQYNALGTGLQSWVAGLDGVLALNTQTLAFSRPVVTGTTRTSILRGQVERAPFIPAAQVPSAVRQSAAMTNIRNALEAFGATARA